MRTSAPNKLFSQKIKSILHCLKNHTLSFTQLLQVCAKHYIKFSSRQQIQSLKQHFNQSSSQIQASSIFSNFQLVKVQIIQSRKYFVIKVRWFYPIQQNTESTSIHHHFSKCIFSFFQSMMKSYGTQANWFKSLGGLTIAINLQRQSFMKGIQRAMKGTAHSNCSQLIFQQFFKDNSNKSIHWLTFMNTIKRLKQIIKVTIKPANIQGKSLKYLQKVSEKSQQRRSSLSFSNYSPSQHLDCRGISLQFKKCKLYAKKDFYDGLSFVKMRKTDSFFRSLSRSTKIRAKTSMSEQGISQSISKSKIKQKRNKSIIISTANVNLANNQSEDQFFPTESLKINDENS